MSHIGLVAGKDVVRISCMRQTLKCELRGGADLNLNLDCRLAPNGRHTTAQSPRYRKPSESDPDPILDRARHSYRSRHYDLVQPRDE